MVDIWGECHAESAVQGLKGFGHRLVENQEQVATTQLVDNLSEQAVLEEVLECSKPAVRAGTEHLHYLLSTPFRYPPLPHGSRFGSRLEPGLFYGSLSENAVLAEAVFYRLIFWHGMETPPPSGKLTTQHSMFGFRYRSVKGLKLQAPPFDGYRKQLIDPVSYTATQTLGTAMREAGVECFEYVSARLPAQAINIALFTPHALASSAPEYNTQWLCEIDEAQITFLNRENSEVLEFPTESYRYNGQFVLPG